MEYYSNSIIIVASAYAGKQSSRIGHARICLHLFIRTIVFSKVKFTWNPDHLPGSHYIPVVWGYICQNTFLIPVYGLSIAGISKYVYLI